MTNTKDRPLVQPRPTSTHLSNGNDVAVTEGLWCPWCGETIRACDTEALDAKGMRLICRCCGLLILQYGGRP
jgi:hypothetical protein